RKRSAARIEKDPPGAFAILGAGRIGFSLFATNSVMAPILMLRLSSRAQRAIPLRLCRAALRRQPLALTGAPPQRTAFARMALLSHLGRCARSKQTPWSC